MIRFVLFLLSSVNVLQLSAQTITGKVTDTQNQPIEFANILILQQPDSTLKTGTVSSADGTFEVKVTPGHYTIRIRALGYKEVDVHRSVQTNVALGSIALPESQINLSEVTVTGSKPIIKREADRIVFDVNAVNTGAINALEVLRNTPGLNVSDNSIRIIGKGEVIVLINNKQVKMSGSDLANLLKTYAASDLDKIEVITTPPARYDAEGNAGVLNIVLKKIRKDYLGGNVSYSQRLSNYNRGSVAGSLTYNKGKVSSFLNLGGGLGKSGYEESNDKRYPTATWKSQTDVMQKNDYINVRAGLDYELNKTTGIGISGEYSLSKPNGVSDNETGIFAPLKQQPDSTLQSTDTSTNKWKMGVVNVHLDRELGTPGRVMHFDADYLTYKNTSNEVFLSNTYDAGNQVLQSRQFGYNNDQSRDIQAFSTMLDFVLPSDGHKFEFGLKASMSETKSSVDYYHHTLLGDQQNDFRYRESIFAAYGDFTKTFNSKWTLRGGLRLEYTQTKGEVDQTDEPSYNTYWRVFPTLYLGYKPQADHSFSLSLSNRISRPRFNMVNPFKLYENRYSIIYGKPDLKPLLYYSVNAGYTLKNNLNLGVYYYYIKDQFGQVTDMNQHTNITGIYWDNYLSSHTVGIENSYTFNKVHWFQAYFQHSLSYVKSMSDSPYTLSERSRLRYSAYLQNTFYFNEKKTFLARLSGSYQSKEYTAGVVSDPYYSLSAGLNYNALLQGKLKIGMNVSDFLVANYSGVSNSNGLEMRFDNRFSYLTLQLSVNYTFGAKMNAKERNKNIRDIKNRL